MIPDNMRDMLDDAVAQRSQAGDDKPVITERWLVTDGLRVEADGRTVRVVVDTAEGTRYAELPDAEVMVRALRASRAWNTAVYPPAASKLDGEFPAAQRALAWRALADAGEDRPGPAKVTEFLRDWGAQDGSAGEPMGEYARTWRMLRYTPLNL